MSENAPPRGLQRFRLTRIAIYFYHRRFTLSFCWRLRWHCRPEWDSDVAGWNGWSLIWGWWKLEKLNFGPKDDWGEEMCQIQDGIACQIQEAILLPEACDCDISDPTSVTIEIRESTEEELRDCPCAQNKPGRNQA